MGAHKARQARHSRLHHQRTWSGIAFVLSLLVFFAGLHWSAHLLPLFLATSVAVTVSLIVVFHFEIAHTNLHPDCGRSTDSPIF